MDLPWWFVVASLAALWVVLVVAAALVGHLIPAMQPRSTLVGGGLAYLFVAIAFWIALGERSLRRRRLRSASSLYRLRGLTAYEFQEAVTELFRLQGYVVTENKRQDDEDGGVDLEIAKDHRTLLVQIKHNWNDTKVNPVRELWGIVASEGAEGAVFVTSGKFTQPALAFAQGKAYQLIDGEEFLHLRRQVLASVDPTTAVDRDPVVSQGFARELSARSAPSCPAENCGKPMVVVTKLTGGTVTSQFWSCPGWRGDDKSTWHPTRPFTPYVEEAASGGGNAAEVVADRLAIARTNRLRLRLFAKDSRR